MKQRFQQVRDELIRQVEHLPSAAVLLSGGIDSTVMVLACLAAGVPVTAYTFVLEGRMSTDFSLARANAERLSVPHVPIFLPRGATHLVEYVRWAVRPIQKGGLGLMRKSDIECTWPIWWAISAVDQHSVAATRAKHSDYILIGIGADTHFGLSKKAAIMRCGHDTAALERYRVERFAGGASTQERVFDHLAEQKELLTLYPFLSKPMREIFRNVSWVDLNYPRQKADLHDAFGHQVRQLKIEKHTNFQLGDSGISDHFKQLLDPDLGLNTGNWLTPVGIYNSLRRQECAG